MLLLVRVQRETAIYDGERMPRSSFERHLVNNDEASHLFSVSMIPAWVVFKSWEKHFQKLTYLVY
jgi:hypothetical protein